MSLVLVRGCITDELGHDLMKLSCGIFPFLPISVLRIKLIEQLLLGITFQLLCIDNNVSRVGLPPLIVISDFIYCLY